MSQIIASQSISLDGFAAGPSQDLKNPLGIGGEGMFTWAFATETFQRMHGEGGGSHGVDDAFARRAFVDVGAWVMGRNMFGPIRGAWPDEAWRGWWGENPPYHVPVFVLTHHPRPPLVMAGGTTFHFVTNGADAALRQAEQAAAGKRVRIGGGASTIRQYLTRIDELHLALSPVLLGEGEPLFAGLNFRQLGFTVAETAAGENATHFILRRS
ncbi:MAG TPA: dihydrofolate reductase family protein [Terriglobales bacterium]|nr:dihydrofolate reductase family protein [Terriglobales bacterium]